MTHWNEAVEKHWSVFVYALTNIPFMPRTRRVSAKPCGLNFHRLGLSLIVICAYPRPQRVRFTDCGAKVFPVLGSATSTEVLQSLQYLRCRWAPITSASHCCVLAVTDTRGTLLPLCHRCQNRTGPNPQAPLRFIKSDL